MIRYFYDCYNILNKVYGNGAFLKQAIADTQIEEKNRRLTVKVCYGVLDKEIELSYSIRKLTEKSPKMAIRTILKIAMYAIKYLEKAPYAVIDNAVELTKKLGKKGACGFVNAFLRRYANEKFVLPSDEIERLSVQYSYPEYTVRLLQVAYGTEAETIMASENKKTALRFPIGTDGESYFSERKISFEKTPIPSVFLAENFVRNQDYDQGVYTFQSVGSAAICSVVEPCERLLDVCAAPGGKSVNLAQSIDEVISLDIYPHRVRLIEQYAERMHVKNIKAEVWDATVLREEWKNSFDAVLCDVPCSGFGVVNDNPDIKLNRKESSLSELNEIQRAILQTCSQYVKRGGYLYYSTCSIFPRENEDIVRKFLEENPSFQAKQAECLLPHKKKGEMLQFLPHISMGGGYFVAKIKRL